MALILKNATFNDMEGLEKIISLFKKGSITPFALSSELTIAARDVVALRNDVYIEVVKEKDSWGDDMSYIKFWHGNASNSFRIKIRFVFVYRHGSF